MSIDCFEEIESLYVRPKEGHMAIENYTAARKIGQKAARSAVSNGAYPYLRALDEFVSREDICGEQPLGIVDIPLDKIAGTKTSGRKNSFANNFRP